MLFIYFKELLTISLIFLTLKLKFSVITRLQFYLNFELLINFSKENSLKFQFIFLIVNSQSLKFILFFKYHQDSSLSFHFILINPPISSKELLVWLNFSLITDSHYPMSKFCFIIPLIVS